MLEENESEGVTVIKKGKAKDKKAKGKHVKHVFTENENKNKVQQRRKSEDLLETRDSSNKSSMIDVDQTFNLIPRIKHSSNVAETHKSTTVLNSGTDTTQWGNIRGSNSFAAVMNISSLSTYTIPRVSLSHHNKLNEAAASTSSRKSLPDNQVGSTFIMRHDTDDSAA